MKFLSTFAFGALGALGMLAVDTAHAAETTDLAVGGTLRPSACNISVAARSSGGSRIDYGTVDLSRLFPVGTDFLGMPDDQVQVSVSCNAGMQVGIGVTDGRSGTAASGLDTAIAENYMGITPVAGATFGLGTTANDTAIGGYYLHLAPQDGMVQIGSMPAGALRADGGGAWVPLPSDGGNNANRVMLPTGTRLHTWAPISRDGTVGTTPATVTTATMNYEIFPAIRSAAQLPLTGQINLDGLATFTLHYL